jgi:hypothetical protein
MLMINDTIWVPTFKDGKVVDTLPGLDQWVREVEADPLTSEGEQAVARALAHLIRVQCN